ELLALSALSLAGITVLVIRRRAATRPLRRSIALLVDSFALGLVMLAALLVSGAFEFQAFEGIKRVTFAVLGLAAVTFLIGLMNARLSGAAIGDLLVRL